MDDPTRLVARDPRVSQCSPEDGGMTCFAHHSTTLGTRKKCSSVAGAFFTISSAMPPSVILSSRCLGLRRQARLHPFSALSEERDGAPSDLGFTRDRHFICASRASPTCVRRLGSLRYGLPLASLAAPSSGLYALASDPRLRLP